jgi:hypothetical protein
LVAVAPVPPPPDQAKEYGVVPPLTTVDAFPSDEPLHEEGVDDADAASASGWLMVMISTDVHPFASVVVTV